MIDCILLGKEVIRVSRSVWEERRLIHQHPAARRSVSNAWFALILRPEGITALHIDFVLFVDDDSEFVLFVDNDSEFVQFVDNNRVMEKLEDAKYAYYGYIFVTFFHSNFCISACTIDLVFTLW